MNTRDRHTVVEIGKALVRLREAKGFTSYRPFANEMGMEPRQYYRLENGETDFKISSLMRVLDFHGITLQDFLKDVDLKYPTQ